MPPSERYAFGNFVLERSQQRVLQRDGSPLALTPRLFNAMLLFVEHAGELLEKDALMQALWPGLVVEENNLSQVISGLRRALGDDAQGHRFIQTVPRRGFRFVATVTALPPADASSGVTPPAPPSAIVSQPHPGKRQSLRLALAGGAAMVGGVGWWAWSRQSTAIGLPLGTTLAVLPFKPLGAERRDDLLELGMADSLVIRLSAVRGLAVRSTSSVLRYAGAAQDPLRAARELDVTWIVDGSLQRLGDRLRATARLLRAADGVVVWSGSFDEPYSGVFDIQEQISQRVMQALASTLQAGAAANAHLAELGGTRSTEAYQLYLAASWRAQDMRGDSADKAIALLKQALGIDPSYALAWAMLAWAHRRKLWRNDAVPSQVFQDATAALERALVLAPQLAQARSGLGHTLYFHDFDWAGAAREFRAALATNPNEVSAHFGLALVFFTQGHIDDGFLHMRLARELDPMSPVFHTLEASLLLDHGQLGPARLRLERALDIAPQHGLAHMTLGKLLFAEQRPKEGIAALRRAVGLHEGSNRPKAVLAEHLAAAGDIDEARTILNELLHIAKQRYVPPTSVATVHAALGDVASALSALEQAYATRDVRLTFLKDDRSWTPLRNEPRYLALLKKLALDRYRPGLAAV